MKLDHDASEALKQQGQQLALRFAGDWADVVVDEFRQWAARAKAGGMRTTTIERFRAEASNHPSSTKAWGTLPRTLVREGLIAPLIDGEGNRRYAKAAAPRTHAHPVALWRLL